MLQCDGLHLRLGTFELGPLSLEAAEGCITVLVGPNAAGKTTLLRCLAGVMPTGDAVQLDGEPLDRLAWSMRSSQLAFVPQRVQHDVPLTVAHLVAMGRVRCRRNEDICEDIMEMFGLEELAQRPVSTLSEGQRQRAHLARAFAQVEPGGVLVLDEPTAPLDPDWAGRVWHRLDQFASHGGTVIASVHDLAAAAAVAEHAWLIKGGRCVAAGASRDHLTPASVEALFGTPFTGMGKRHLPLPAWMDACGVSSET